MDDLEFTLGELEETPEFGSPPAVSTLQEVVHPVTVIIASGTVACYFCCRPTGLKRLMMKANQVAIYVPLHEQCEELLRRQSFKYLP